MQQEEGEESVPMEDEGEAIMIPVRDSEELVRVNLHELPNDADEIIDILKAEFAPLYIWLKFALEYYKRGSVENFKLILDEGADEDLDNRPEYSNEPAKKQRIAILNVLAAYYVKQATKAKETHQKEDFFNLATANYNKADKIDIHEEMTWVGKGVLLLYKGVLERAQKYFETVLEGNPENTPALLGKACIAYNKGSYDEALKYYCTALRTNPSCPANVRLGLAQCYYRLGRLDLAQQAFERVLKLEPDNAQALAGLGVLELNAKKTDSVHKAMTLLKKAYEADPTNPLVLNHLSNHFFYKKDYNTAMTLAQTAYNNTQVREIKAESFYYFGRAYHAQNQLEQAFKSYFSAVELWPEHVLAQFGLGQLYVHRGDYEKAITCFDVVLKKHPDNYETLKLLGALYAVTGKKEKAIHNFRRVTESHPKDAEAWIELASLIEKKNFKEAHDAYQKGIQLMEARGEDISPELWNNIGVLRHKIGDLVGAEAAYRKVLELTGATEIQFKAQNITTLYNLALLYEAQHQYDKATTLYKAILKEHPNYLDCYLRLGCMAKEKGHIYEASEWFKETFMIHPNDISAWSLLGNLHLAKGEWLPAQKKFEYILAQQENRNDPYALLSLANIYYSAKFDKKEKEERYISHAMKYYWQVMVQQPNNIYAANGLGIILAEKGQLDQAKDFFIKVREATSSVPDVWINLGHVYMAQGQYVNAIKMYQNCLKKFYDGQSAEILLYLSKAYFEYGRMEECKKSLIRAIHLAPDNNVLWYDLALSQKEYANRIVKRPKPALKELDSACKELEQCCRTFKSLGAMSTKTARLKFNPARAAKYSEECEKLLERARTSFARVEKEEQEAKERRETQLRKQLEDMERQQEEAAQKTQHEEEERVRIEQMAQEAKAHLEILKGKWSQEESLEASSSKSGGGKGRKRKQAQFEAGSEYSESDLDADMVSNEAGEGEAEGAPKKRGRRSKGGSSKEKKSRGRKSKSDKKKPKKKKRKSKQEEEGHDDGEGEQVPSQRGRFSDEGAPREEGGMAEGEDDDWKEMRDKRATGMAELVKKRKQQLEEERLNPEASKKRKGSKEKKRRLSRHDDNDEHQRIEPAGDADEREGQEDNGEDDAQQSGGDDAARTESGGDGARRRLKKKAQRDGDSLFSDEEGADDRMEVEGEQNKEEGSLFSDEEEEQAKTTEDV